MLQNAYLLAKIGADTAENEQHFAEICQKLATTLRVRRAMTRDAGRQPPAGSAEGVPCDFTSSGGGGVKSPATARYVTKDLSLENLQNL